MLFYMNNADSRVLISDWKSPLLIVVSIALLTTWIFWVTDLDVYCANLFYVRSAIGQHWPQGSYALWQFLFFGAPIFTGIIAIFAVWFIIVNSAYNWQRLAAIYMLLTLVLGPGLLINLVFKDHWGRPRPYQLQIFGGTKQYLPPLAIGEVSEDKSFPAGHASIGFVFCIFWFLYRKHKPLVAWLSLLGSIGLGLLFGIGRMAAGAHFLSDVLWAGYICFFSALVCYYWVLKIPHYMTNSKNINFQPKYDLSFKTVFYSGVGILTIIGALLGFPIHKTISYNLPKSIVAQIIVDINLQHADVMVYPDANLTTKSALTIMTTMSGFGLPNYRLQHRDRYDAINNVLFYRLYQRGFFTELHTSVQVFVAASAIKRLKIRVHSGNIQVFNSAQWDQAKLDIVTSDGQVSY